MIKHRIIKTVRVKNYAYTIVSCIRESNSRNYTTCLLHVVLGIVMQYKLFTSYESCSRKYYE